MEGWRRDETAARWLPEGEGVEGRGGRLQGGRSCLVGAGRKHRWTDGQFQNFWGGTSNRTRLVRGCCCCRCRLSYHLGMKTRVVAGESGGDRFVFFCFPGVGRFCGGVLRGSQPRIACVHVHITKNHTAAHRAGLGWAWLG